MTLKATEVSKRLTIQAGYEMNATFCEENSPQFVDEQCARMAFYSARRNLIFRPSPVLKTAIDNAQSFTARLIYNLKKLGVKFSNEKPFFFKVGYGHINLKVDAVIESGFPDFPQEQGILLSQTVSGAEFRELIDSQMPYDGYLVQHANLLMAHANIKKTCIFIIARNSGEVFAQVVDLDYNKARRIQEASDYGVTSQYAPERIIPIKFVTDGKASKEKCGSCYFAVHCMLPDSPPPICQNCEHCILGPDGFVACGAQTDNNGNPFQLNIEMQQNMHQCKMHIYRPDIIDSWAELIGPAEKETIGEEDIVNIKVGNHYANKLTGVEFFNIPESMGEPQGYTSYEIYGSKGKDLVGDKGIDKLRAMFGAKIQGVDKHVSGSDLPD